MKRSLFVVFGGILLSASLLPISVSASVVRFGENSKTYEGETVSQNVYLVGSSVVNDATIQGDAFLFGDRVVTNSHVTGDVLFGADHVDMQSAVEGDVRGAANTIAIRGRVGGDVALVGNQITITQTGVHGDALIVGSSVIIDAPIVGSVRITAGSVYINAPIKGDLRVYAKHITLGPSAIIEGSLIYTANEPVTREFGAVVQKSMVFTPNEYPGSGLWSGGLFALQEVMGKFFLLLAGALFMAFVFRRLVHNLSVEAVAHPFRTMGWGILTLFLLPLASIFLLLTVIGIPLGLLGIGMLGVLVLLGLVLSPVVVGTLLDRYVFFIPEVSVTWQTIFVGTVAMLLLALVPTVGWFFGIVFWLISVGAFMSVCIRALRH